MLIRTLGLNAESNHIMTIVQSCKINQSNCRHLLLMWNRHKTLLRDHLVPEVNPKGLPEAHSVSAIPETLTIRGPKRPPINDGEYDLRGICSTGRQQVFQFQSIWLKTGVKLRKHLWVSSRKSISKEILDRGWEVLLRFDSEAVARVSGAAETVDYFG